MELLHKEKKTWELVELPKGKKAIRWKWVRKKDSTAENKGDRFKARLVCQGFAQKEGIDYNETFSSVVKLNSVRIIFTTVAMLDMELEKLM